MNGNRVMTNVERAQQVIACVAVGKLSGLSDLCHEDLVMELPFASDPSQQKTDGKQACLGKLSYVDEAFDHFAIVPHEIYDAPAQNAVIVEATSFGQYKSGGAYYQNRYAMVMEFRDDKVVLWREFFNPLLVGLGTANSPNT